MTGLNLEMFYFLFFIFFFAYKVADFQAWIHMKSVDLIEIDGFYHKISENTHISAT